MISKYQEQVDDSYAICPYCEHYFLVESEDYDEDQQEITCDRCGKNYYLRQSFSVTHHSIPDCSLNGDNHKFRGHTLADEWNICGVCGVMRRGEEL